MEDPSVLGCDPRNPEAISAVQACNAARNIHPLTRRGILNFITAQAKDRAEQIQTLLDVSEIEETRRALVGVKNDLDKASKESTRSRDRDRDEVKATIGATSYSEGPVLAAVNQARVTLGAKAITTAKYWTIKEDLGSPRRGSRILRGRQHGPADRGHSKARKVESDEGHERAKGVDTALRELLNEIRSASGQKRAVELLDLTKSGLQLLDDSGACPLCDTEWPPGRLREHLTTKVANTAAARALLDRVDDLAASLTRIVNTTARAHCQCEEGCRRHCRRRSRSVYWVVASALGAPAGGTQRPT